MLVATSRPATSSGATRLRSSFPPRRLLAATGGCVDCSASRHACRHVTTCDFERRNAPEVVVSAAQAPSSASILKSCVVVTASLSGYSAADGSASGAYHRRDRSGQRSPHISWKIITTSL